MATPPRSLDEHVGARAQIARGKRIPGGDPGARQGRGLLVAQMFRNGTAPHSLSNHVFGQNAIDIASQRALGPFGGQRAVVPVLHEDSRYAVTRFEVGNPGPRPAITGLPRRAGNPRKGEFRVVESLDHQKIAVIE